MQSTSIIITNWNRWEDVEKILHLLLKKPANFLEVIIVDNGSDNLPKFEYKNLPKTHFVFLEKNYGPCIARNRGAKLAKGEFLFFLDSDAILSRRAIRRIENRFRSEDTLALVGCRVEHKFERKLDQWIYAEERTRKKQEFDTYSFSACGAAIRRSVFEKIGGFNEKIFIYNEEVDLSYRIIREGYRVSYDSQAVVYHFPSNSGRETNKLLWQGMIRHWIWIFFSFYPKREAYKRSILYSFIYLIKGVYLRIPFFIVRGILEGFKQSGSMSRESKKFTAEQISYVDSLNKRRKILFKRS